ncbi:MFS transporter [Variovorax sp. NFACC27]|uniref:CynX/NimT family MFS transporter n=1 Tax=unclassified Variovorax TaxID=663243 RepID=UPI000896D5AB|nr:MFS transporter [Variovorax sp. YR750]SEF31154.1 MFS transporter, CP family, cyanate transporter [Variovorax sp. NFACC28]SEG90120.1 MFS transporter, CP family, cyanate transporter [Variovorax sp. NFACC29]SFD37636.1 MFS transporter, CP family, cyanate transporter [Variovorax sp. NFACC26]SFG40667.1 MFS transporter, CP family, cyanate transporter [Variovorax sp. NFACC27]SEL92800.1 MFS transporter, CP family, cyanate transporter [Variovorax sp. YR750]
MSTATAATARHSGDELLIDAEADTLPVPRPTPAPTLARRILLGASVVLIAFNLRPVFASLSVVLPEIIKATGLSATAASLLTTLPIVCLGVFAPLAPGLGRRFGTERTLLGCMVLILVGTVLRGTGNIPLLFLASAIAGSGIAVSNVLLSGLVKRDFASQAALMMGLYTMAVCGGAASAAGLTVPIEHALGGGWTMALAMWALPAALVTLIWAPQALPLKPVPSESGFTVRGLWRDRLAWQVTFFMGLQSALAYIVMGWLAPILRERGLGSETAGYVVSLSVMTQVVTCLVVPALAVKLRNQRGLAVALAMLTVGAMLAMLFAPLDGVFGVWAWAVLLGIAQGGTFALALTMIVLRSPDSHVAAHLSGMAQGVGYMVAAFGPLVAGLLHGWTGSFRASSWLFIGLGVALVIAGLGAGRTMHVGTTTVPRH